MSRATASYLVIGANVAILAFVSVLLIVGFGEGRGGAAGESPPPETDRPQVGTQTAGVPEPEPQRKPDEPVRIAADNRPPVIDPETVRAPEPPELPEETSRRVDRTRRILKELLLSVEIWKSRHGDYPPSRLDGSDEEERNGGIEALAAWLDLDGLLSRDNADHHFGNGDDDHFPEGTRLRGVDVGGKPRLEILDAWGNPLVYYRYDRYATSDRYLIAGRLQTATPQISVVTGKYHAEKAVMIWSAGPDGKNENGKGDDVTSWHIRE